MCEIGLWQPVKGGWLVMHTQRSSPFILAGSLKTSGPLHTHACQHSLEGSCMTMLDFLPSSEALVQQRMPDLVDHAVEHVRGAVVRGGRKERIARMEGNAAQRVGVVAQRPVGLRRQVQVEPGQLAVLRGAAAHNA